MAVLLVSCAFWSMSTSERQELSILVLHADLARSVLCCEGLHGEVKRKLDCLDGIIDALDEIYEVFLALEHSCVIINILVSSHVAFFKLKTLVYLFKLCEILEVLIQR